LANGSGLVGRNLLKHLMTAIVQRDGKSNSGTFRRSVSVNDFYWGDDNFAYPMGHIQNTGGLLQDVIYAEAAPILSVLAKVMPGFGLKQLAMNSIGWWAQTEVLPDSNNRVRIENGKLYLDYKPNNLEANDRLIYRWKDVLKAADKTADKRSVAYPHGEAPIQVVAHQCGTCRFGEDPATSVLDPNCRTHELENLYVVDSSFFPSMSSMGPALTVIANALRVGDHLVERLK
ncbi:MAG: GMC oxidoreductase, partial [Microcoleaceae cyanobacterium]